MKVLINSNIYLKAEDVNANRDLKTMIRKKYSFRNSKSFKDKIDFRTIFTKVEKNGKEYYVLPPNLQYFMDEIVAEFPDIDFQISDKRVAPEVCNFSSNITPRENQIPILEDIKNSGYNAIVAANTGFGKAQPLTEPILTSNGWDIMGNISAGDYVLGSNGEAVKVLEVFPQGIRDIYKISFIDGTFVNCDRDHLWTVYNRWNNKKTLTVGQMLESWISKDSLDKRSNTYTKEYNFSIDKCKPLNFGVDKDISIHPYLIGLLLGDGGFTDTHVKFTNSSTIIKNRFEELLPDTDRIAHRHFRKNTETLVIQNKVKNRKSKLKEYLENFDLFGKLSIQKHIPKNYLNATLETRQALYQGLIDTDGYVKNGRLLEYSTSSKQLALDFLELGRSLGKVLTIQEREPKYKYKNEEKIGVTSYRIYEKQTPRKSIISIEYSHQEEAQCIMVDAEDSLYVTRGYNLTHNTTMSLYITEILRTNMLFIASRTSLIQNLLKDVNQFGIDLDDVCEINAEWLKNPIIKPVMYATIQALSDEILKELFDKVGLLVADEIHLGIGGLENVERLFSINPKYRLYLSATYKNLNYIGLNEALLSSTIITSEENISHTIEVDCYHIQRDKTMMNEYKNEHTSYGKKQIIYDEIYCQAISEMVFYMVKKENRGVLVYVESQEAQAEISNMLKMYALKVGILNSNTKKSESEHIINNFDKGDYDVIVAGNSISAGVSLYRLSIIINCNITTNENNLTQLIGRMKRFNPEICDKQKKYIQICIKDMSSSKWKFDKKCLEKFEYIKFGVDKTIDYTDIIYYNMMNEYKRR